MARLFARETVALGSRLLGCVLLLLLVGANSPPASAQARTVATPTAEPAQIRFGQATKVRFSADINDPALIPGTFKVLRHRTAGTNPTIVGVLRDDGNGADVIARDGRHSLELSLNEAPANRIAFRDSLDSGPAGVGVLPQVPSGALGCPIR